MSELPALRQVVLLTGELSTALERARGFLGLHEGIRDAPAMAELGFEHEVLAIDRTFVEIVAPLSADSSPGRLLARKGEGGYMVVLQVADVRAVVDRGATLGIAPVVDTVFEGNPMTQWHPRDLGTLAEIDQMAGGADWHFCPELSDTGCTDVVADITGAEIAVADPIACAQRWAALLGLRLCPGATVLDLGSTRLLFCHREGGRDGLRAVDLAAHDPGAAGRDVELCGVRFRIGVPA